MKQRKYFDVHGKVGRHSKPPARLPHRPEAMLGDMRSVRVHGAAVSRAESADYSFVAGDARLMETVQAQPRLYGIATLPPTAMLETGDPDYLTRLLDAGFRGVKILPSKFNCGHNPRNMEQIAGLLIERGLPLFYPCGEGFEGLTALLEAYRELNMILLGASWGDNRQVFPLLERYPRLHFEYSRNQANDILELTKQHFGIGRALYGTGWPGSSMGALKSLNEYAVLSEDEKDLVAHGNACRLLKINPTELALYDDSECEFDAIAMAADQGLPMPVPVLDAHTHMAPAEHKTVSGLVMLNSSCEHITPKLDRLGVEAIITAPWEGIATDGMAGNAQTVDAAQKYPGRYLGWNTCNLNYDEDLALWRSWFEEYPDVFVGIKPYWPYQGFSLLDERLAPWLEYANERRLLLLLHCPVPDFGEADTLCGRYPDITFVLAHAGSSYETAEKCLRVAKARPNALLEITYTTLTRGLIEYLVSKIGAERVLYGSDLPMRDPAPQLGWVAYARISEEDKKKIFYENIKRLMGLRHA
ncbi:MAG: amidohydrolase family protein [Firmicutes bacterium]|nr:amidohydrolase family protein [Bacillota bacterium]